MSLRRSPRVHPLTVATGLCAAALATLAACADAPSAPRAPGARPAREIVSPEVTANALTRNVPLAEPITVSGVIGPDGGYLEIKEAGVKMSVDSFTVSAPTVFTVTALAGRIVAYDFTPEGHFDRGGVKISQLLTGTSAEVLVAAKIKDKDKAAQLAAFEGGYFKHLSLLNNISGTVAVSEFLPVAVDMASKKIEFKVKHFSGYMVSTGRQGESGDDGVEVGF